MTKAENYERYMRLAKEKYDEYMTDDDQYCHEQSFIWGYQEGYEQAEKDLALTKDDVWRIFNLVRELQTKYPATEGCLQEVADIINEQRKK